MTTPAACPSCGAALRPGQPWCTLCYADLRPAPEPPEPIAPAPPPTTGLVPPTLEERVPALPVGVEAGAALVPAAAGPTWPCSACGTANSFERDTCAGCGQGFLAGARDEAPLLELPVVGDLTRLSRAQRLALAAGVVVAVLLVVLVLGLLLG